MAETTVFSLTTTLLSDLWLPFIEIMWFIPLALFWLLCIAAVAVISLSAVDLACRLITKDFNEPFPILGKIDKDTPVVAMMLSWAEKTPTWVGWPGPITLGLSCVLVVLITHIIIVIVVAFGCLMVMGGQYLLDLIRRQATAKVVKLIHEAAAVSENVTDGSQAPHGAKRARAIATPSTTTASSMQARDASEDTTSGWQSWDSIREDLTLRKTEAEARLDDYRRVVEDLRAGGQR
ncbi:hypothetical protein LTR17_004158 [Elasticomyces elasticus]|nr:hypothetical protein LTR17_004158 [Elasticomyces elasticus]